MLRTHPILTTLLLAVLALSVPSAAQARDGKAGDEQGAHMRHGHERKSLARHFTEAGTTGTMVVRESRGRRSEGGHRSRIVVVNRHRARERYLPSSTFKIPNALLAIERGVASGPEQAYPGPNPNYEVDGKPLLPKVCEGDLTLATALANSCIPIFQRIARDIGLAAYERAVRRWHYGNRDVDGAPVDEFWLRGPFAISAVEQVRFLDRLRRGKLKASKAAQRDVRRMLVLERKDGSVLHGKTGYVFSTDPKLGWFVGWVQRGRRSWTFALNLDITKPEHFAARTAIARSILAELGAFGRR